MASTIQIKRSSTTGTPSTLNPGELAYSNSVGGSGVLFIGSTDGATVVPIGGARTPGTLTANQALVANSTSGIDRVYAANVDLSYLNANGSPGTSGYVLFSGGSGSNAYWAGAGGLGVNAAAQYSWTNTQSFSNTVSFGSVLTVGNSSVNASITSNSSVTYFTGTAYNANNAAYLGGTPASSYATQSYVTSQGYITSAALSGYATESFVTSQGYLTSISGSGNVAYDSTRLGGTDASAYQLNSTLNANIASYLPNYTGTVNATSHTAAVYGSASGGFLANSTVIEIGNSSVNGAITSNATTTYFTGTAYTANNATNLGGVAASGYQTTAGLTANLAAYLPTYTGIVNASSFTVGTNLVANATGVYTSGTVNALSVSVGTSEVINSTGIYSTGIVNATALQVGSTDVINATGIFTTGTVNSTSFTIGSNFIANTTKVTFTGANIDATSAALQIRDATISGNLTINGTLTTVDTNNLSVKDSNIKLADQNTTTDTVDAGWYGLSGNSTSTWYSGMVRKHDASGAGLTTPVFQIFSSNVEPTGTVDQTAPGFNQGTLLGYLNSSGLFTNSSVTNITANSTVSSAIVANTLTLTTALAAQYGGTGQNTYSVGDLLYASGTTALSKLSVPGSAANGQILQIVNNLPAYATLDGGAF